MPPGHVVNPLKLQDNVNDIDSIMQSSTPSAVLYNHTNHIRTTRDTEKVVNTRTIFDKDGHRHRVVAMVSHHLIKLARYNWNNQGESPKRLNAKFIINP